VDLLRRALPNAATTPQVIAEQKVGMAAGRLVTCDWDWLEVAQLPSSEEADLGRVRLMLNDGEPFSIAVDLGRNGGLFSDDRDARRYARRHKLSVSGTLGVLSLLVRAGHITVTEADDCLQQMIAHGYRSPVTSVIDLRDGHGGHKRSSWGTLLSLW
jgi:predicted nucleic acid-binding protein